MKSPCELVARYILPVFRALVAKELMDTYSFSQNEVAEKLGITQAAVSHYINSRRGAVMMIELEKIPDVKETVTDLAKSLAGKSSSDDMILAFCRLCSVVKSQKVFWDNFAKLKKSS